MEKIKKYYRLWATCLLFSIFPTTIMVVAEPDNTGVVRLDVPLVEQANPYFCGTASIEMILRYWGEERYDQFDVAWAILHSIPDFEVVKESGILDDKTVDWTRYPGTWFEQVRALFEPQFPVELRHLKDIPSDPKEARRVRDEFFDRVKLHLRDGVPVMAHQYLSEKRKDIGHYRVMTGYDDKSRIVYLNDPSPPAKRITQSYDTFLKMWNMDKAWHHYPFIALNYKTEGQKKAPLKIDLPVKCNKKPCKR